MLNGTSAGRGSRVRSAPSPNRVSTLRTVALSAFLVAITSAALLIDFLPTKRVMLNAGDVSPVDILAPADLTYTSAVRTKQAQDAQARAVADIYDPPDASVARQQEVRAQQILDYISTIRQDSYATLGEQTQRIAAVPDFQLSPSLVGQILALDDAQWQEVRDEVVRVLQRAMQGEIRDTQLDAVRRQLPTLVNYGLSDQETSIVVALAGGLVQANTLYNATRTEEARQLASDSTPPVTVTIRRGEAIVRAGDQVTALSVEALDAYGLRQTALRWQTVVGTVLFALIVVAILELFVFRVQPTLWERRRTAVVITLLIGFFAVLSKLMLPAADVIPFLYPLPALSMILTVLFGPAFGVAAGVTVGLVSAFVANGSLLITVYVLAGTLVGALVLGRAERLRSFLQAAAAVALTNAAVVVLFGLVTSDSDVLSMAINAVVGVVMGGLAASLALAAFFALSSLLDVTTPFHLMELSRPTHPLFRQLLLKAPGTYHHTLLVSNMAEEAADRIGADGLLARVGAYYHDIGKTTQPYFFAENRVGEDNPHERLDPRTSAQIIINHVQDGLNLAEKYKLPAAIRSFIAEHHGSGLALSFYRTAVKAAEGNGQTVREEDFRYPGPKPQSKETAVVMLADACEARVRGARPGSVEEIDRILRETIKAKLDAGEIDESDLTLHDLEQIRAGFLHVLQGVFHPRVQYPEPVKVKGPDGQEVIR